MPLSEPGSICRSAATRMFRIGLDFDRLPLVSGFFTALTPVAAAAAGVACCWLVKRCFLRASSEQQLGDPRVEGREFFWRGRIQSRVKADEIMKWAGWVFAGFGFFLLCERAAAGPSQWLIDVLFSLCLFELPAILLLTKKHRAAAGALLAGSLLLTGAMLFLVIDFSFIRSGVSAAAPAALTHLIFMLVLAFLSWRALKAAGALRKLQSQSAAAEGPK
jgi:hypothetical protein